MWRLTLVPRAGYCGVNPKGSIKEIILMQKQVNQRQLSWLCSKDVLTAERFMDFAKELQTLSDLGPVQSPTITFSGGALPIQLTGDPTQVAQEFEQLTDRRFVSASTKAVFPNSSNLTATVSCNLAFGHLTISVQNGTDENIEKVFSLVVTAFPRATGATDEETEKHLLNLSTLIKEATKASQIAKEAEKNSSEIVAYENRSSEALKKIEEIRVTTETIIQELNNKVSECTQKTTEITNFRNQTQSDRDTSQKLKDDISALESKIREFFNEISEVSGEIQSSNSLAETTVKSCKSETESIITENQTLQKEVKEHLLKAVGSSLFSAFEQRKKRIEVSKWVWAAFTCITIIAQVVVIVWVANHVQSLSTDIVIYKTPSFLLRVTVSIPILFFLGYSIHQYAREREYEELYGFKSSISFSLSPYLDLVKKLNEETDSTNGEHRKFVIETIKQIFENPLPINLEKTSKGKTDSTLTKDILDQVIKIIEKRK